MLKNKQNMIELLTGVKASKRNYYTELKKTIMQLEKKNMKLEIINDVMKNFNINMSMNDMLKNVMDKLKTIYTFDRLSLSIYENSQLILSNVFPTDSFYVNVGEPLPKDNSIYWKVIEQKNPIHFCLNEGGDVLSDIERVALQNLKIQSILLFPLVSKKKVIGVLSFGSKQVIECEETDASFLQQLADQLAVCIENARLYNAVLDGKKEWEETFRAVEDMLVFIDMSHTILRFNDSVSSFFGLAANHLYGKNYEYLFRDAIKTEEICPVEESFRTKKRAYSQMHFKSKCICDVYTYPVFNDQNEMYGVILYIKDVTEKLHTEAQLIQSGKHAALGEMAAGVAHELNSPLTAILGNSQLLLREVEKTDPSYKLLEDIRNCGDRCKNIIRNLLTFSRQDEYLPQECLVNDGVEQVLSLIGYQIERQNITISACLDENIPVIEANLQQIEQIIINFLLNAKDSFDGCSNEKNNKITIETGLTSVDERAMVYLSVTDTGAGIKDEDLSEIYRPFYTTKQQGKGTGLGLSVSLGIAKMHGGMIDVRSQLGHGSTFTLLLPVSDMNNE
ncbi:ATP-binding protein [Anaerobacillus sp. MEB173]|uniref:GAF domain-containing sensor histidine kinase n=1 Tax=Anaerobacillus sp. MEB173 TaxID=3383345 RepID=UPI003F9351CE